VEVDKFTKEIQETKRELQILENRDMIVSLGCAIIEQSGFDLRLFLDLQDLQGTSQCSIAPRHEQIERQRVYGETLIKAGHLWLTRLELMNEEGRVSCNAQNLSKCLMLL